MKNNNFTQALKELTGFDVAENTEVTEARTEPDFESMFETKVQIKEDIKEWEPTSNHTYITSTMVITGEIKSEEDILSEGQIFGDVYTSASFCSSDLMVGNLEAQEAELKDCRFKGKIKLEGSLKVTEDAAVVGDINCETAIISGKVKGNLDVSGAVVLKSNALIVGDIITDNIGTEPGTRINGKIITHSDEHDFEKEFDFGGAF